MVLSVAHNFTECSKRLSNPTSRAAECDKSDAEILNSLRNWVLM